MGDEGKTRGLAWIRDRSSRCSTVVFLDFRQNTGEKIEANPLNGIVLITRSVAYIIFGRVAILYYIGINIHHMKYVCITFIICCL